MKKTFAYMMALPIILALNGCYNDAEYTNFVNSDKIKIVATTSIVANFAQEIGQDRVVIYNMIKSGMDAHTYNTTPADLKYLKAADLILTSGLELESRIEDVLDSFSSSKDKAFYTLSDGLDSTDLLEASHEEDEGDEEDEEDHDHGLYDPHFWLDASLSIKAVTGLSDFLATYRVDESEYFASNLSTYVTQLEEVDTYVGQKALSLEANKRILLTTHDALSYFARAYGFDVYSLQGISTDGEISTTALNNIAQTAKELNVKAIFLEDGLSDKSTRAVIEAAEAINYNLSIGGELFTDTLGSAEDSADTYVKMMKTDIERIVSALA